MLEGFALLKYNKVGANFSFNWLKVSDKYEVPKWVNSVLLCNYEEATAELYISKINYLIN